MSHAITYQKSFLLILLLLVVVSIGGCSKSEKEKPSPLAGKLKLIQRVSTVDESKFEYGYDNNGFLTTSKATFKDGKGSLTEYINDSEGKPISAIEYTTKAGEAPKKYSTVNYTYQSSRLVEYKQVKAAGLTSVQKYVYNNKNVPDSSIVIINPDSANAYVYEKYEYIVNSGGILAGQIRTTYPAILGGKIYITAEKYEFDDKPSPFASGSPAIYIPHNIIKATVKHDAIPGELVYIYAFDYNANGLPIKEYSIQNGVKTLITIYEYY